MSSTGESEGDSVKGSSVPQNRMETLSRIASQLKEKVTELGVEFIMPTVTSLVYVDHHCKLCTLSNCLYESNWFKKIQL